MMDFTQIGEEFVNKTPDVPRAFKVKESKVKVIQQQKNAISLGQIG